MSIIKIEIDNKNERCYACHFIRFDSNEHFGTWYCRAYKTRLFAKPAEYTADGLLRCQKCLDSEYYKEDNNG
jgi:hypothetical protein